jgi:Rad3-related DNA helicase
MGLRLLSGYQPKDLGLDGYEEFRRHPITDAEVQLEVIEYFATCKKPIIAAQVPPGFGKSLIAMAVAKMREVRTVILTATLGLEKQYMNDMERYGLVNVHGKARYTCEGKGITGHNCLTGVRAGCNLVGGAGCTYEIYRDESREAEAVITNYDYWFNINLVGGIERQGKMREEYGPNPVELLICDEAHELDKKLSDFMAVRVYEKDLQGYVEDPKTFGEDLKEWKQIAIVAAAETKEELDNYDQELSHLASVGDLKSEHISFYHELKKKHEKFEKLCSIDSDWVIDKRIGTQWGRMWAFDIKWPGKHTKQFLVCKVPKVILMSATLRPHHMRRNGFKKDDYEFMEWESIFPKNRCPVYYLPPRTEDGKDVRITAKSSEGSKRAWVEHIDGMLDQRMDRRCLVLTTSYAYQKYFQEHSRHSKHMIANNAEDPDTPTAAIAFEQFIETAPPVILVSPSFGTGWDLKMDRCEFMVISKVPLKPPPSTSKLAQARFDQDPEYFDQETASDVEQARGRPQRSDVDRGEVVIADGTWGWWSWTNQHLFSPGFVGNVRKVYELPKRPEKLRAGSGK